MDNAALLNGHHKTRAVFKRFSWKSPLNRICTSRSCHICHTVMNVERWAILRLQRAWSYISQGKPSLGLFKKEKKSFKTVGKYESVLQKRHPQSNTFVSSSFQEWTVKLVSFGMWHHPRGYVSNFLMRPASSWGAPGRSGMWKKWCLLWGYCKCKSLSSLKSHNLGLALVDMEGEDQDILGLLNSFARL